MFFPSTFSERFYVVTNVFFSKRNIAGVPDHNRSRRRDASYDSFSYDQTLRISIFNSRRFTVFYDYQCDIYIYIHINIDFELVGVVSGGSRLNGYLRFAPQRGVYVVVYRQDVTFLGGRRVGEEPLLKTIFRNINPIYSTAIEVLRAGKCAVYYKL